MASMKSADNKWNCNLCTLLNDASIKDCAACGTERSYEAPPQQELKGVFFKTELLNKKMTVSNNGSNITKTGMIREIKLVDQFEDEKLKQLIKKYDTCTAICGYLSCAIPNYLINHHQFPFDQSFRKIAKNADNVDDTKDDNNDNIPSWDDIIYDKLCNAEELAALTSKAMDFIQTDRDQYIKRNGDKFKDQKEKISYMKAWVANYEISRYIESMDCANKKYIVFLRCNQYRELEVANREERDLILEEEKPFGSDIRFLIEFFGPRKLIKCDKNEFKKECKERDIDDIESLLWILDLHGHYNCAFTTKINVGDRLENNVVIMDTYNCKHCQNPAPLQCFDLVFNNN